MDGIGKSIEELGILITIAAVFLSCVVFAVYKLFGNNGIVDKVTNRHIVFIDKTESMQQSLTESQQMSVEVQKQQCEEMSKQTKLMEVLVSQQGMNREQITTVGENVCNVLETICDKLEVKEECKSSISTIRDTLKHTK